MIITEAIAQIMHEADRQLTAIHGVRNIDSWAMLGDARKKERIAMVEMIKAGSEMPAVSVDTELGRYRSRLMKSIVAALSGDVEEITNCELSCAESEDGFGITAGEETPGAIAEEIDSGIRSKNRKTGMTNKSTKDTAEGVNDGI